MEAILGEFGGRDVIAQVACPGAFGEKVLEHAFEVLLGVGDVVALVEKGSEFAAVPLLGDARVRLKHRRQSPCGGAGPAADLREVVEVPGDLTFVPGEQDRLDVGKWWCGLVGPHPKTPEGVMAGSPTRREDDGAGAPPWVKVSAAIAVVLVAVFLIVHLAGGGMVGHTP
nr:hypothetical protein [Streptomyces sp. ICC1]